MNNRKLAVSGFLFLSITLIAGCDPLTRNHYEIITVDVDTRTDVKHIIGEPTRSIDGQWHYERPEKHLNVFIDFNSGDVVTRKQWIDNMTQEWSDTMEPGDSNTSEKTIIRTIR